MTGNEFTAGNDATSVRKVLAVDAPPAVAWRVFTAQMGRWWPLRSYTMLGARAVDAVIEPHVGGRWYERGDDGSTCTWGHVLAWEPPRRLVLSWEITADFKCDPDVKTEVEVRFIPDGRGTRVEFEHRNLDTLGLGRDEIAGLFDSEMGWTQLLDAYVAHVAKGEKT